MTRRRVFPVFVLPLLFSACSAGAADVGVKPRTATLVSSTSTDDIGVRLYSRLGVVGDGIVLVEKTEGGAAARQVRGGAVGAERIVSAGLSPCHERLAVIVAADEGAGPSAERLYEPSKLVVFDSLGVEQWSTYGVVDFRWSPSGEDLLILHGRAQRERLPLTDSCTLWRGGVETLVERRCQKVSWLNADTVLTANGGTITAIAVNDGGRSQTALRTTDNSPGGRYGFEMNEEGSIRLVENASGTELAGEIGRLLGDYRIAVSMSPFWIPNDEGRALFCVAGVHSSKAVPGQGESKWQVFVIDIEQLSVTRQFPGKGIRPTPDRRSLLVAHGGALEFVDLGGR